MDRDAGCVDVSSPGASWEDLPSFSTTARARHEPLRIEEVGRYLRDALGEVGDYQVNLLIRIAPRGGPQGNRGSSGSGSGGARRTTRRDEPEAEEARARHQRGADGLAALEQIASLSTRPEILCRTYLVYAEAGNGQEK